jgi:hypothetical protein
MGTPTSTAAAGDKGDFDRVIKDFVQAIRLDPKRCLGYYDRGMAREKKHRLREAWPISKCILNSLLPTRMALRL